MEKNFPTLSNEAMDQGVVMGQMNIRAGDPAANFEAIKLLMADAKARGASVLVLPELCVSGYMIGDLFKDLAFMRYCESFNGRLVELTKEIGVGLIWGNVSVDAQRKGQHGDFRLYNAAFAAQDGRYLDQGKLFSKFRPKTNLPNYGMFDDKRYFTSSADEIFERGDSLADAAEYFTPVEMLVAGVKTRVGIAICEDMWDEDYVLKPVQMLKKNGSDMIVNISASPFGLGKWPVRDEIIARHSEGTTMCYLNHVGLQNNGKNLIPFDGRSVVYRNGKKVMQAPTFAEGVFGTTDGIESDKPETEALRRTLVYGIRQFMGQIGKKKIAIGLSGWVDSAVVTALCVESLGAENVITVNMPSRHNSDLTKDIARDIAQLLGVEYFVAPIQDAVDMTRRELEAITGKAIATSGPNTLAYENIQARDRSARILSGIASLYDAVFTNNGNKVEAYEGYATLYGDVSGAFAPLGDLLKGQVYDLARLYVAEGKLPESVVAVKPSAELSDNQDITKGLGDPFTYEYQDALVTYVEDFQRNPEDIVRLFASGELKDALGLSKDIVPGYFASAQEFIAHLEATWKRHFVSVFKGIQSPPNIAVARRPRGYIHRESQIGARFTDKYRELVASVQTV